MQIFDSDNYKTGSSIFVRVPPGQWAGFCVRVAGTNDTGDTAAADFGNIRLNLNGRELMNVRADVLQFMNDLDLGFIESASTVAAAYAQSCYIAASVFIDADDHNIFHVTDEDNLVIEIVYDSSVQDDLASATIDISGNYQLGVEQYLPIRLQEVPSLAAGTTPEVFRSTKNIVGFYFTYTNITRLMLEIDDAVYVNDKIAGIQGLSNLLTRKEATFASMAKIDTAQGRTRSEALSDSLKVTFTNSAAETPECVPVGMYFDARRHDMSREHWAMIKGKKLARAARAQPLPPVYKPPTFKVEPEVPQL